MIFKDKYEDYTESEFLDFLADIFNDEHGLDDEAFEKRMDKLIAHFEKITEHPRKIGLISHPAPGVEDSPVGVLCAVKAWRAENGKPGFRPE